MNVIGALSHVSARRIGGWACEPGNDAPVTVRIRINGREIASLEARELRLNVKTSGQHPTGLCAFSLELSRAHALKDGDLVSVSVVGAEGELRNSPAAYMAPRVQDDGEELVGESAGAGVAGAIAAPLPLLPPLPTPPARTALAVFRDSLMAILLRMLKQRFGLTRFGYFWAILVPIAYVTMFTLVRQLLHRGGVGGDGLLHGVDGPFFFLIGLLPFLMFIHAIDHSMGSTRAYQGLFTYRQVQPLDVVMVTVLIEFLFMLGVMVVLSAACVWFGLQIAVANLLAFAAVIVLMFAMALGLGLLAEVAVSQNPDARNFIMMIQRPFVLISGTFYTMGGLAPDVLKWLWWNPLLHLIDLCRGTLLDQYQSPASWLYAGSASLVSLLLGMSAYHRFRYRLS